MVEVISEPNIQKYQILFLVNYLLPRVSKMSILILLSYILHQYFTG